MFILGLLKEQRQEEYNRDRENQVHFSDNWYLENIFYIFCRPRSQRNQLGVWVIGDAWKSLKTRKQNIETSQDYHDLCHYYDDEE